MVVRRSMVPVSSLLSLAAWGEVGLVTWLHPQPDGRWAIESASSGVTARVLAADGSEVTDTTSLAKAGWAATGDGFWQTPPRAGGMLSVPLGPGAGRVLIGRGLP